MWPVEMRERKELGSDAGYTKQLAYAQNKSAAFATSVLRKRELPWIVDITGAKKYRIAACKSQQCLLSEWEKRIEEEKKRRAFYENRSRGRVSKSSEEYRRPVDIFVFSLSLSVSLSLSL